MNIKSLLIGSAAALAAVSGAQAADAIVAAEPEPMEYVRVCDAFGTGFFYIPGTETCLKFQGYVRFQVDINRGSSSNTDGTANGGRSDWDAFTRAQFEVDTRSDTELGALRGFIGFRGDADNAAGSSSSVSVHQAFIELGGLKVGLFANWWDDGLSGEVDNLSSNRTRLNAVRYTYDAGSFYAGVAVEELENVVAGGSNNFGVTQSNWTQNNGKLNANNVGVSAIIGGKFGDVSANLLGGYDTNAENGAVRAIVTAAIGPGTFGLSGVWASGANAYYEESEWAVAAEYAIKATDKLTITPGVQYARGLDISSNGDFTGNRDAWRAGVAAGYKIAPGLSTLVSATYQDVDGTKGVNGAGDSWTGFVRLQRAF